MGEQFMLRFVKQIEEVELQFLKAVCKSIFLGRSRGICCWVLAPPCLPLPFVFIFIGSEIISVPCRSLKSNLSATQSTGIFLGKGR